MIMPLCCSWMTLVESLTFFAQFNSVTWLDDQRCGLKTLRPSINKVVRHGATFYLRRVDEKSAPSSSLKY